MSKLICEGKYHWTSYDSLAETVCKEISKKTKSFDSMKGKWKFEFTPEDKIPWPWPDVTRVRIGAASVRGLRIIWIAQGKDWIKLTDVKKDSLGVFDEDEARIAIKGTSGEVVILEGAV